MPYDIHHALEVARRCPPGVRLRLVALLHDVLEDTDIELYDLAAAGVPNDVLAAVEALTRLPGEAYVSYIERVADDFMAKLVKIADLQANLARMDAEHESLRPRYEAALHYLTTPRTLQ